MKEDAYQTMSTSAYIVRFSLPLIAGSILQQLYNTVDAMIVGRFLGENSLAAVSVASPISQLLTFFIYGIGIGMTVLFSQGFGTGNRKKYRRMLGTALAAGSAFSLLLAAVCFVLAGTLLVLTQAPAEILPEARAYLRIIVLGLIFNFLYNYYSSALLSIGDSRTPFLSLAVSSVTNIVLDFWMVAGLHLGVAGAAWATILAQFISMLLLTIYIRGKKPVLALSLSEIRIDRADLRRLLSYGGMSAVQQTVLYGGRLLVQGAVNQLPVGVIAGYGSACRIESFMLAPMEGISSSASSYCARAIGAGDAKKVRDSFFSGLKICLVFTIMMGIAIFLAAPAVIRAFLTGYSRDAMYGGVTYLRTMSGIYLILTITQMLQSFFRGIGRLDFAFFNTILQISFRVALTWLLIGRFGVIAVCLGTLAGWISMCVYGIPKVRKYLRKHKE